MAGSKRLEVIFAGDASGFTAAKNKVSGDAESLGSKVTSALGGSALAVGAAAVAAIGGLSITLMGAYNAAVASQKVTRETERVIKTTGGAAHVTAEEVAGLAKSFSDQTGISGRLIRSTENLILTFSRVRNEVGDGNDIFNQATKAAFDMSTVLGTDASGAAIQLGKALNDPIKGITALSRAGVSFTQQQKDQIKAMMESGNILGAQKIILKELAAEFGGAAEAAATPLEKLQTKIAAIPAIIGGYLVPAVNVAATWLGERLPGAISAATGFITDHAEAIKYLASVGLAGLAVAYIPVITAQAVLVASRVGDFFTNLASTALYAGRAFVTVAGQQGILVATTQALEYSLLPLGAALALLGGLVYGFISSLDTSSEAANEFFKAVNQQVDTKSFTSVAEGSAIVEARMATLRASIKEGGNSIGDYSAAVADLLIPFHDVNNSVLDQQNELSTLTKLQAEHTAQVRAANDELFKLATQSVMAAHGLDVNATATDLGAGAALRLNDEINGLYQGFMSGGFATDTFRTALATMGNAAATADEQLKAFKDELNILFGVHIASAQAANSFGAAIDAISGKVSVGTVLTDAYNAKNREASGAVLTAADAALKYSVSLGEEDGNLGRASAALETNRNKLVDTMVQSGMTRGAAEQYIATLGLTPENVRTLMQVNKDAAEGAVNSLRQNLNEVERPRTVTVHADTQAAYDSLYRLGIKLSEVERRVIAGNSNYGGNPITRADGGITLHQFAEGGHIAQIAKAGDMRLWAEPETGGEAYIPLSPRKRRQSTAILGEVARMFGLDLVGAAGPVGGGGGRTGGRAHEAHVHFHLDGGGYIGSEDQLARALDHVIQAGLRKGLRMGANR